MPAEAGTIVLVEDDPNIADLVDLYLRKDGFRVLQATTGERGLHLVTQEHPRLVILDVGLAGTLDGLDVCRQIRERSTVPVLMLTARDGEVDRILGLELGADDYVTKPFSPRELVARIKAILRRTSGGPGTDPEVFRIGVIVINPGRREVRTDVTPIALATREFDLLLHLAQNAGLVLTRRQLLDAVWGPDWYGDERTVDVHVRQLRKKLGPDLPLATVWGVGYRMS